MDAQVVGVRTGWLGLWLLCACCAVLCCADAAFSSWCFTLLALHNIVTDRFSIRSWEVAGEDEPMKRHCERTLNSAVREASSVD